jgi:hypothetical protein
MALCLLAVLVSSRVVGSSQRLGKVVVWSAFGRDQCRSLASRRVLEELAAPWESMWFGRLLGMIGFGAQPRPVSARS